MPTAIRELPIQINLHYFLLKKICVYNTVHELCDIRDICVNGEIYTVVSIF